MTLCETETFYVFRPIHNALIHCGLGGDSCECCCKYVRKVSKNNYYSVASTKDGGLIRCDNILHNAKRVVSDIVQQIEREKA